MIGFASMAMVIGGHFVAVARWRGEMETKLAAAEKDREILHARIGEKEDAIQAQLKELTDAVHGLEKTVAVLVDREKHPRAE